jgi:dTDP-4-dehydrorhamnose 3,5-epimerase
MVVRCHEFAECGPNSTVAQMNISFNYTRGILRGLHRRMPSYAEAKLVCCTRGAIVDVEVRPSRRSYVAHGFQTLANKTEVICQVSGRCKPAWVIYRIADTNPAWVVGAEPRR